jgi:hypothetical protein
VSAGVDFVAVDTRGYIPGSAVPNQGGDPRALAGLVDAINRGGYADKLKIAAFDDIPASMTDKKNQACRRLLTALRHGRHGRLRRRRLPVPVGQRPEVGGLPRDRGHRLSCGGGQRS